MIELVRAAIMAIAGIGMATALFSSGRQTVPAVKALLGGSQKILYTAESGKLG